MSVEDQGNISEGFDRFHEECGVVGIWNVKEAANLAYLALYAQQHRGQEGAGVVALENPGPKSALHAHKGLGLVSEAFDDYDFTQLPGTAAIGHVRYATAGGAGIANVQPLMAQTAAGSIAVSHNGNLINTDELKEELSQKGAIFGTTVDTEVILHLMAHSARNIPREEVVISAVSKLRGAYSLTILFEDRLFALRDPNGFRPLVLGELDGGVIVASETCAFDLLGAKYIRDIEPGEIVEISGEGIMKSFFPFQKVKETPCVFEYVYFARPDSKVFGRSVYQVRRAMGVELAKEHPVPHADMVIPVPDSGVTAAVGFASEAGIPLELGLIRNHYVGRTFIEPKQSIRNFGVKIKLNANSSIIKDKVIIVVDDSIVRGTTSRKLVEMLRKAGAKEVHMRISSPPTTDPCYYGIDTPSKGELIAAHKSREEIQEYLCVESLHYLSREGLYRAVQLGENPTSGCSMCDACFSGNYPIGKPSRTKGKQGELFS
jgi:amidophosphoribosyltransferase